MKITDFAEIQRRYTGAINKRKWVIKNRECLQLYFQEAQYKPAILARQLKTSYATVKRFLCAAGLWDLAAIRKTVNKGGRKRTSFIDKFGYRLADATYDVKNDRGEIVRRYEHHVVAEQKIGRSLKDNEIVHHINLDKLDNRPENLFVCQNNVHHRLLHGSLEREAGKAVKQGLIKFHEDHGYYLDNEEVVLSNE